MLKPNNYYDSIYKTPMGAFKECYCYGNLQSLVISGEVEDYVLEAAWQQIKEQYANALGDTEQLLYLKLLIEVNTKAATINQAKLLIQTMKEYYTHPFGKLLNELLGHKYKWPDDRAGVDRLLANAEIRIRSMELQHAIKKFAFDEQEKKMKKATGEAPTPAYFDTMMNFLEDHFPGTQVNDQTVVSRYCERVKRMYHNLKNRKK